MTDQAASTWRARMKSGASPNITSSGLDAHNRPVWIPIHHGRRRKGLVRHGNLSEASGSDAMQSLLQSDERLTAVFVASGTVTFGALAAVRDASLQVPEDVVQSYCPIAGIKHEYRSTRRAPA
jgi:hypothetical protein